MRRLVIVSNRIPIPKARVVAAGGLAVALRDLLIPGSLWFGWSGRLTDEPSPQASIVEARGVTYATIDLTAESHRGYYAGFSNGALWPLLHFRIGLTHFRREDYAAYLAVNATFASALEPLLGHDDMVWAHDYHLIPFGRLMRERGFRGPLGFFLHIPFAPPSMFEVLPVARQLLADLCAYDVVAFQTEDHARDFSDCAQRLLGASVDGEWLTHGGRRVHVLVDPIGIDAKAFAHDAERAGRDELVQRVAGSLSGRALAIGVDRMDYSKGLTSRFEAYGRLLDHYPEHRRKVQFLQICPRSREEVAEYRKLRVELDQWAGRVNGRFSELDWTPIRYSTRAASRKVLAGLYRMSRVGVVTPFRDGMNLVAKEYLAAQADDDPGVLVLSRFAGAARELDEALIVNPFDPDEISDAIHVALDMPVEERKARHRILKAKVLKTTAQAYCQRFIEALEASNRAT